MLEDRKKDSANNGRGNPGRAKTSILMKSGLLSTRSIVAGSIAIIGIAAVAWTFWGRHPAAPRREPANLEEKLAMFGLSRDDISPIPDTAFSTIHNADDVDLAMSQMQERLAHLTGGVDGLGSLPVEVQQSFARAATLAIAPFLTGDMDQLIKNERLLGGALPDSDEAWRRLRFRWEHNNANMDFTSIAPDWCQAIVRRRVDVGTDRFGHLKAGYQIGMKKPGAHTTRTTERFPNIAHWDKDGQALDVYEARVPIKILMKKSGDTRLGMIGVSLAQNPETGQWQPAEIRLYHDDSNNPEFRSIDEVRAYMDYMPGNLHM